MNKLLINLVICLLTSMSFSSCITPDVPISTSTVSVVHVSEYPIRWHHPLPPPPPRRPSYVCPPPRNPYKPVWQQRPDVRPMHDGFGNMNRKPIDRPRNVTSPRNKNFGGRR